MYWNNLNDRERWMAGIGLLCGVCYLFYLLIYSPLTSAVHDKIQQVIEKKQTLAWMEQVRQYRRKKAPEIVSGSKRLTVLSKQLSKTSFKRFPYQLQQTGVGDIQLSFDEVPYNAFITWLWTINDQYAFSVKRFNAERTKIPGVVKLRVVLI